MFEYQCDDTICGNTDFDFDIPLQNITAVLSGIDGEIPGSNNTIQIGSEGILYANVLLKVAQTQTHLTTTHGLKWMMVPVYIQI